MALIGAALIVGGLVDRSAGRPGAAAAEAVQPVPVAAPAAALSSSWFCAGATDGGTPGAPVSAPGHVVIANDGAQVARGWVTVVPSQGSRLRLPVEVGAYSSTSIPEAVPGGSAWVGAVVDIDAGLVAVEQVVEGAERRTAEPCATSGSRKWYFASGQTRVNADTAVSLLNPYPIESIVDITFSTDQGRESPEDFQAVAVPAGGLVTVDVGTHLRRRASMAMTVSARTGSIVAWETQWVQPPTKGEPLVGTPAASAPLADPALPVPGLEVGLGAPSTATRWVWPDGVAGNGFDEQYVIYNPGSAIAQVSLSIGLDSGSAEPFRLTVGPGQAVAVVSEQQARIPAGVPHFAVLQSNNAVGIVAARVNSAQNAGVPPRQGISTLLGGRLAARGWIVPAPGGDQKHVASLVVLNPGSRQEQVTLASLDGSGEVALPGRGATTITPGGRVAFALPAGQSSPLVVRATGPVFVEADLFGVSGAGGNSAAMAVPFSS